jgi:beta-galactosidase/beta-glucuronidase
LRRLLPTALALPLLAAQPAAGQGPDPPEPVELERGWEYVRDRSDDGLRRRWWKRFPARRARQVTVPHVFQPRPHESSFKGTTGWYRLRFTAPPSPGYGWALRFEGSRRHTRVWVNGRRAGASTDPYVPFTVPVRRLRSSRQNEVIVRVSNRRPRKLREGWWNWGGLIRRVRLVPRGRVVLRGIGLMPRLRCGGSCRWSVLVDATVQNRTGRTVKPRVRVLLRSPAGVISARAGRPGRVRPGQRRRVRFSVPVEEPSERWSPAAPSLYEATVRTEVGPRTEQLDRRRIGLRTVRVGGGRLYLNGLPLDLRGASIHEDMPGRGAALDGAAIEQIVADLKAVGANVTRAHYLLDERLLTRLDEEGILVWSQAANYNYRDGPLRDWRRRRAARATLRGTVLSTRSHPSVITHSIGNELRPAPDDNPGTRRFLREAARLTRRLDPTLPVSLDVFGWPRFPRQHAYRHFDALGINHYFGWYPGRKNHSTRSFTKLVPFLREMRRKYPRKALVITEYGAEATTRGPSRKRGSFAFQVRHLKRTLDVADRVDFLSGAIYWTLREFAIGPSWRGGNSYRRSRSDTLHHKGLLHYDGTPKPAWEIARERFIATPVFER